MPQTLLPGPVPAPAPLPDVTAQVAALYPADLPASQLLLASAAVRALRLAGLSASTGRYGDHATADAATARGSVVLVPMAGLWDLDPVLAAEDDSDPAVWHVLARDRAGRLLEPDFGYSCPSVLWAVRAGIDPIVAPGLVAAALAHPRVAGLLGVAAHP